MNTKSAELVREDPAQDQYQDNAWEDDNDTEELSLDDGQDEVARFRAKRVRERAPALDADAIKQYFQEIRKTPLLTFAEEQALGKRIQEGDAEARAKMIQANLRLVVAMGNTTLTGDCLFPTLSRKGTSG